MNTVYRYPLQLTDFAQLGVYIQYSDRIAYCTVFYHNLKVYLFIPVDFGFLRSIFLSYPDSYSLFQFGLHQILFQGRILK